jgi:hypothetical protein
MDLNPKFGQDHHQAETARRVVDMLWESTKGDLDAIPPSYLDALRFEYSDGFVSALNLISVADLPENPSYEEFSEAVEALLRVNPDVIPDGEIAEIQLSKLEYEFSEDWAVFDESEFNFAEEDDMSSKMETFWKKIISSVYLDGVTSVTDAEGNPPNSMNNYLFSPDGKTISGIFYDSPGGGEAKKFPFKIVEGAQGKYTISY